MIVRITFEGAEYEVDIPASAQGVFLVALPNDKVLQVRRDIRTGRWVGQEEIAGTVLLRAQPAKLRVRFTFGVEHYSYPYDRNVTPDVIMLPTGVALGVTVWSEVLPPRPVDLRRLVVARADHDPDV